METHERDFTTRDKLDMVAEAINALKERVFLLELAVWREACLVYGGCDKDRVCEMGHAFKLECRIKSRAEVIVHDVLPFIENEPIQHLIDLFKAY